MADDSGERSTDSSTTQGQRRWRTVERSLLGVAGIAFVWLRYGLDAALSFIVLPLCLFGIVKAIADIVLARRNKGTRAAARALADHGARIVLLGLVGAFVVAMITAGGDDDDDGRAGAVDPCTGSLSGADCEAPTSATPTTESPRFVPTTVTPPGERFGPECPPSGNEERRLSFTTTPPFCLDRAFDYVATVETNYGTFDINLNMEGAPFTVNNFAFLAGWHFYDGVPLVPSRPVTSATSLFVGDPVAADAASVAPGYTLTFDNPGPTYPDGAFVVMTDGEHPNRFEIAISRSRREEIASNPGRFALLGEIVGGDDVIIQNNLTDVGPRLPSETIVIASVTIKEAQPAP